MEKVTVRVVVGKDPIIIPRVVQSTNVVVGGDVATTLPVGPYDST
jgi:hypothetical protein